MQDLRVIGVESGALLVSAQDGSRYRIAIDEVLQSKLRQAAPDPGAGRKLAPREIQAQIRSGMSAQEVASVTGVPLDYIQKFEGPVLAEREFVIQSALNVAVHTALDTDPTNQGSTFGSVIRDRLHDLGATGERWASWKEADNWIVKLSFTADQIDHDARWQYEPRKSALAPLNSEANTLSQQGEMAGGLIPRLRAVGGDERSLDSSRFDSGAFDSGAFDFTHADLNDGSSRDHRPESTRTRRDTAPQPEHVSIGRGNPSSAEVSAAAINRAPTDEIASNQTADLLEALRRRRGERENAAVRNANDSKSAHPSTGSMRVVDVPLPEFDSAPNDQNATGIAPEGAAEGSRATAPQPESSPARPSARKGRAAMPSWDEIVFGARSDDNHG